MEKIILNSPVVPPVPPPPDLRVNFYRVKVLDRLVGSGILLPSNPELKVIYSGAFNTLCLSNYDKDVKCVQGGSLVITLNIQGNTIEIKDQDSKKGVIKCVRVKEFIYYIQGLYPEVRNKSKEETYIVFSVQKTLAKEISWRRALHKFKPENLQVD